jgi:hypothetical protein
MARTVSFGGGLTEAVEPRYMRQRAMADALTQQSQGPISGWGEGVANLARTAAAGFINNRADTAQKTASSARAEALRNAMASGDPQAALQMLGQSEDPELQGMALNYQMAKMLEPAGETFQPLTNDQEREMGLDPAGTYQRSSTGKVDVLSKAPDAFKPEVGEFYENGQRVKGYLDQQGNLVKVGDSAPLFAPQQAPAAPEKVRLAQEAGLVPGTKEYSDFLTGKTGSGADPFKQANTLRDEYNTLTKDFRTVQDAYAKIQGTSATGAGDMSMLYSYVKLLDPGSVVRESEFATAAASGSFGEQVQGAVQRLATGERLPDSLRAAFKSEAGNLFKAQKGNYERVRTLYSDIATRNQVNPQDVIPDFAAPEAAVDLGTQTPAASGAPAMGGGADEITEGTIIVNPQTQERLTLKGGQWVPVGAGR